MAAVEKSSNLSERAASTPITISSDLIRYQMLLWQAGDETRFSPNLGLMYSVPVLE